MRYVEPSKMKLVQGWANLKSPNSLNLWSLDVLGSKDHNWFIVKLQ